MYSVHPRPGGSRGVTGTDRRPAVAKGEMLDLWSTFEHWQLSVVCTFDFRNESAMVKSLRDETLPLL